MVSNEQTTSNADAPSRKRPEDLAARYRISKRTAGEWLRAMVAEGIIKKALGKKRGMTIGRWSAIDAWVENGGSAPGRPAHPCWPH